MECARTRSGCRLLLKLGTSLRACIWHISPFDAGQEDMALAHRKDYLSWLVQRGRDWCEGCGRARARMRKCSRAVAAV